MKDLISRS